MIRFAAELLKRVLSPAAFQRASYCWWCIQVYTLRRIAAIFIERTSVVYGQPSDFTDRIRGVKYLRADRNVPRHDQVRERERSPIQLHHGIFGALEGALQSANADL
jgi:hypothetical protein